MRISDWSSDVCSSDLRADGPRAGRIPYGTYRSLPRSCPGKIWHRVSRKDHGCDFRTFVGESLFGTMRPAARPGNEDTARSWRHTDHSECPEEGRTTVRELSGRAAATGEPVRCPYHAKERKDRDCTQKSMA